MKNDIQQVSIRIESLDWLRGIMAAAVMFYHLTLWLYFPLDAGSILGRLGIYAVSVFFVLSGLSMAIVYHDFFSSWRQIVVFGLRRIFRIWPLLWLSSLLIIIHPTFDVETLDVNNLFSTATTLFSIFHPAKYFITGAWSIGNEMVYYLITPILLLAYQFKKNIGIILFGISTCLTLFFSFGLLSPEISLANQWSIYVNPWNNLFFYVAGLTLFYILHHYVLKKELVLITLIAAICILVFMPVSGNQINLVTGLNRIVFSVFALLLVIAFYKNTYSLPTLLQRFLRILGESTYGIYLLHPIVHSYVGFIAKKMGLFSSPLLFISTSIITIIVAYGSYLFIEKPMIKLGKKLTS